MLEATLRKIQGSIDPALAAIRITGRGSDRPEETLTVSCYPYVKSCFISDEGKPPHAPRLMADFRRQFGGVDLSVEELFSPESTAKKYTLQSGAEPLYTAEGSLYSPAILHGSTMVPIDFKIGRSQHYNRTSLSISCWGNDFHGMDPQATLNNFLKDPAHIGAPVASLGERQRDELARQIAFGIEEHFFGSGYEHPYRKRLDSLFERAEKRALEEYQPLLEEQIKANPFQAFPAKVIRYKVMTGPKGDELEAIP